MALYSEIYAHALRLLSLQARAQDAGNLEDICACYTQDAVIEVRGIAKLDGIDAIRETFSQPMWRPEPDTPQRRMVANAVVTEWSDVHAEVTSDVLVLARVDGNWSVPFVARYADSLVNVDGEWLIRYRIDEFA